MKKIVNLTGHDVTICSKEGIVNITIPSEGCARCTSTSKTIDNIGGIDITDISFGEVQGLPEPNKDTMYLVSKIVVEACPQRSDLLIVGQTVRSADRGAIIGATSLSKPR